MDGIMDSQVQINGLVGLAVFTGKTFNFFNNLRKKDDSSEEPEWLFVGSTCHIPGETQG